MNCAVCGDEMISHVGLVIDPVVIEVPGLGKSRISGFDMPGWECKPCTSFTPYSADLDIQDAEYAN